MKKFDTCVIGGGPAGLTAAMYLARSGCSVLLVEKLAQGGQVLQTATLENYPGFPDGVKGYELADLLAAHLKNLSSVESISGEVTALTGEAGNFQLTVNGEEHFVCRTAVVCAGAQHRQLGVEREKELTGYGVSYCALCDGNFYRNKAVAVVGGGNAALEESLYLARIVDQVHLIHRRDAFRGLQVYQDRIAALTDKITLHLSAVVTKLHGEGGLNGITIKNLKSEQEELLAVDALFVYVGMKAETSFLPASVERDKQGFLLTDIEMRTSLPGLFAAGDIRAKQCRQAITAAGDGATAAQAAFAFLEQMHNA